MRIAVLVVIDPEDEEVDESDIEFAEDLIIAAIRSAFEQLLSGDEPRDASLF